MIELRKKPAAAPAISDGVRPPKTAARASTTMARILRPGADAPAWPLPERLMSKLDSLFSSELADADTRRVRRRLRTATAAPPGRIHKSAE